jgi:hypothetical protein
LRHSGDAFGPESSSFYTLGSKELDCGLKTAAMTGGRSLSNDGVCPSTAKSRVSYNAAKPRKNQQFSARQGMSPQSERLEKLKPQHSRDARGKAESQISWMEYSEAEQSAQKGNV